jgi:hypothetical protein
MTSTATRTWNEALRDQLDFHFRRQLRPRLEGLTDDEYFWEPTPGCWSVRPRPVWPAEGPWADSPYADLVLHINRELIHHGAEICLLRDLYRATHGETS